MESRWYNTAELSHPFPDDDLLRDAGFKIADRPKRGQAIWIRDGKRYTHRQALHLATKETIKEKRR